MHVVVDAGTDDDIVVSDAVVDVDLIELIIEEIMMKSKVNKR